jgi:xanthine dehydrogenase iron-sulfur cluster and FAD-binding subunit A
VDLATVTEFVPASDATWRTGDAWLGGGSWLFSEPQPATTRLLDLASFGWPPLTETDDGLEIAATCTLAELARWRPAPEHAARGQWVHGQDAGGWAAHDLPRQCCEALLGSFKVANVATVGGNICLALPAAPMIALTAALDGTARVWGPGGTSREVPFSGFVTGERATVLCPGELLRGVFLPAAALAARTACRQASLSAAGRSAVLLIGTLSASGATTVTLTAAVPRPVQVRFNRFPGRSELARSLDDAVCGTSGYLDDVHGSAPWRRAMSRRAALEVAAELREPGLSWPSR